MKNTFFKSFIISVLLILLCTGSTFAVYTVEVSAGEPSAWAKGIVEQAIREELAYDFNNYQAGITRVEFCRLIRFFINQEVEDEFIAETIVKTGYPFIDTENNNVSLCYGAGIVSGTGGNTFSPNSMLTREQAAVIVLNAIAFVEEYQGTSVIWETAPAALTFGDEAKVSSWAREAVSVAHQKGILKGDGVNFNPLDVVTCEQAIILVYQSYKMLEQQGMGGSYTAAELDRVRYIMQEFKKLETVTQSDFYVERPNVQSPHSAGELRQEVVQSGIDALNLARYIAGMPNDVVDDKLYKTYVQSAAVMLDYIGYLDHTPEQPKGMANDFYYLAYNGTSRSNLAQAYDEENPVSAVWSYMHDSDDNNIVVVGHRRWALSPKMAKTSVGMSGSFSAMYVLDESRKENINVDFLPWPSNVFPMNQISRDLPWSVSFDEKYLVDGSDIKVKMTRLRDNKSWIIDSSINKAGGGFFNVNEDNYGSMPAIIFRLQFEHEEALYMKNDVFFVEIEGLAKPISYTVKLFSTKDMGKLPYTKAR